MLNKITTEEDIEIFSNGPVWEFESHTKDPKETLENVIKIVNALIEAKLFSRRIGFSFEEMTYDLDEKSVEKFIRKNIVGDNFCVGIYGDTTVYLPVDSYPGPTRSVDLCGIMDITVSYDSGVEIILICTNSSIWMPFNIKGRPHIDVYALNLNRLDSALLKIEALGLKFINSLYYHDERCATAGYLLENYAEECDFSPEEYLEDDDDNGIYGVYIANG